MKRLRDQCALFLLCACIGHVCAEDIYNETHYWAQNLTETWELLDHDETIVSFTDMYGSAVYQIIVFDSARNDDAALLTQSIGSSLGGETEAIPFFFNGHGAALGEAHWTAGGNEVHGYIVSIDDRPQLAEARHYPYDYVLIAFSLASEFDVYHDFLMSNLDGFAPLTDEYQSPGVLSQFIRATGGNTLRPFATLQTEGKAGERGSDETLEKLVLPEPHNADIEAAYAIIQRESRILNQFTEAPPEIQAAAWRRFYQMLYKDSWHDMRSTTEAIASRLSGMEKATYPAEILSWLQDFAYSRSGTLSDLEPAQVCIANKSGDCDSLGLAYMAILDHLGIDSILMISPKHAHSLVGVNTAGAGARFPFMGTRWLIAELTADVPIGMIAQEQADPADWMGFDLSFHPEW